MLINAFRKVALASLFTLFALVCFGGGMTTTISFMGDGHSGVQTTLLDLAMGYEVSYYNQTETWQQPPPNDWMKSSRETRQVNISQFGWAKELGWPDNQVTRQIAKYDFWVWDALLLAFLILLVWTAKASDTPASKQESA